MAAFQAQMQATVREPRLITTRQAAAVLGVHVDTVRRAADRGDLRPVRLGGRGWLRFRVEDVEALTGRRRGW